MASRMSGMSLGPIWWTTVQEYCDKCQLDETQTMSMHFHLKKMDEIYLTHMNKKAS